MVNTLRNLRPAKQGHLLALKLGLFGGLLGLATLAWGLDFAAEATSATRGQPLHLRLTLRTESHEELRPDCIRADVIDGERLLSGPDLHIRLQREAQAGQWTATVVTQMPITQASQTVTVSAGCGQSLWRRYTLKALPSPEQGMPLLPTEALPAAQAGSEEPRWRWIGSATLALLGAAWAWHTRRRVAGARPWPSGARLPASPRATASTQIWPTATPATDKRPGRLLKRPMQPVDAAPADQAAEHPWPDVESQANALSAQGRWVEATALVAGHVLSARRAQLMPYLTLLQLQRRLGDRAAFDDTRALMQQNFKLHAPSWSGRRCSLPAIETETDTPEPLQADEA